MQDALERLRKAIRASRLNETDLADRLGIHRTTLNRYLHGRGEMPTATLMGILELLGLRLTDLFVDEEVRVLFRADQPEVVGEPFFARSVDRLRFYSKAIAALGLSYPEVGLPNRHKATEDPTEIQDAALETRRILHLPERGPVTGIFSTLSRAVKVIGFRAPKESGCDGFSLQSPDFGVGIAINLNFEFERRLATVAHELGHAVLHPDDFARPEAAPRSVRSKDPRENAAWAFAGHFLLPVADLRDIFAAYVGSKGSFVAPTFVVKLKRLYGVSAKLALKRLLDEKYIDGRGYGFLNKTLYPNQTFEELHALDEAACATYGSPEDHFQSIVARMYFESKVSESRVAELLELDADDAEKWLANWYDESGEGIELAS